MMQLLDTGIDDTWTNIIKDKSYFASTFKLIRVLLDKSKNPYCIDRKIEI